MLKRLIISNYALIDEVDISFEKGFSVITGETGAGKSIMLGALSLILGQRSDSSAKDKSRKCVVEVHFNVDGYGLEPFFESEDVDYDHETVIRREILDNGKSRAFVNDTPVNLNFLKELHQKLIDIHSQHQNLLLRDYSFQLKVVDTVADNQKLLDNYRAAFFSLKSLKKERAELIENIEKQQTDKDYWLYQTSQLHEAKLKNGEQEELEQKSKELTHAEEIRMSLATVRLLLSESEFPLITGIFQTKAEIDKISTFLRNGANLCQRIDSMYIELKDINREISEIAEVIEFDPHQLKIVKERLDLIYSLQQKHRVDSIEALLELKADFDKKIETLESFDEILQNLDKKITEKEKTVMDLANYLSQKRLSVLENIHNNIENQLRDLGMPNARFSIIQKRADNFRDTGIDEIQFLFSANKNSELADIPKVASGGEISRVMLCIKALISAAKGLPTVIFDEIDMGVSGEIADKMGRIMQKMSENIQVISITHLPQIAGKGDKHYKVYKTDTSEQTVSEIKLLTKDERIVEIAGMLSGAELTEAALQNAKHLLNA